MKLKKILDTGALEDYIAGGITILMFLLFTRIFERLFFGD